MQIDQNWRHCTLGDVITLQRGFDLPERERQQGIIPIVSSSGVTGHHNIAKVKGPGVVTGRYGTLGEVFYIKASFWPLNTTLFVRDFKGNHPLFISYFLKTLNLAHQNGAGAVPGVNRNALHLLPVHRPPLPIQRTIASILSAYDDLIENNTRRIAVLEGMARMLYEEWFVKFRFPGHEQVKMVESELGMIPEGWEATTIGDVVQVLGGGTPSTKVPEYWNDGDVIWFSPTDLTSIGTMFISDSAKKITSSGLKESSARLFPAYSVMMTSRATIGVIAINTKEACTNQGFIICIPNERLSAYQIYHWLEQNRQKINSLASGATFKEINRATFKKLQVLVPSENMSKLFDALILPIYKHVENLIQRNANLRRTRDLLLPKLISGEIDVSSWAEGDAGEIARELAAVGTMDAYSSGTGAARRVAEAGPIEPMDSSALERHSLWEDA
jgi:type I restriction enzyme, S subunit